MTTILTSLKLSFSIFKSKKSLACEIAMLKKELQILQRNVKSNRVIKTDTILIGIYFRNISLIQTEWA